jgi:hypothetical protein
VSKALVDLEGFPFDQEMLEEIGLEHSKTLRGSTMEPELFDPEGGAPLAAQLDGEEWPAHPRVRIDVAARALRLLVPRGV